MKKAFLLGIIASFAVCFLVSTVHSATITKVAETVPIGPNMISNIK